MVGAAAGAPREPPACPHGLRSSNSLSQGNIFTRTEHPPSPRPALATWHSGSNKASAVQRSPPTRVRREHSDTSYPAHKYSPRADRPQALTLGSEDHGHEPWYTGYHSSPSSNLATGLQRYCSSTLLLCSQSPWVQGRPALKPVTGDSPARCS